jgi:ubiquitin
MLDDYKFESNTESIIMYIKTLTGKQIIVNVNPKITKVGELKLKMQDMEGIPPEQQRFVFNGRHLEDDNLLSYYNVQNESCFHLVLRLRGCMYNELYGINGNYEPLTNIIYDISEYEIWDF